MTDLLNFTKEYIRAFDNKDLSQTAEFFNEDAILYDPANPKGVIGKDNISRVVSDVFNEFNTLNFVDKKIYIDNDTSIIEFELELDAKKIVGVDIIKWQNNKIQELRAYLY